MTENFYPVVLLCDFTKCSIHKSLAMKISHNIKKSTRLPILRLKIKPDIITKTINKYRMRSSPVLLLCDFRRCSTHKSIFALTKLALNKASNENDIEEEEYIPSSGASTSGESVTVVELINKHNSEKSYKNEAKKSTHKTKSNRKRKRIINSDESTGNDYKSEENTSDDSLLNHVNKPKRRKKFRKKLKKFRRKNKINKKRKRNVSSDESTSDDYDSDESFIDGYECDESSVDSDESESTSNRSESEDNNRNNKHLNRHKRQKNHKSKLRKHTNKHKKKKKIIKVLSSDESSCVEVRSEKSTSDDNDSDYCYESRKKRPKTYKIKQKSSVRKNNKKYKHKKQVQSTDESSSDNDKSEESANEDNDKSEESANEDNEKSEETTSDDSKNSEENTNDDDRGDWIYKIKHKKSEGKSMKKDKKKKKKKLSAFEEMILKKQQEKLALIKSLKIDECRDAFKESLKIVRKQPKKRKEKDDLDTSISSRKSLRLKDKDPIVYTEINIRDINENSVDERQRGVLRELREVERELSALRKESRGTESNKSYLRDRKRRSKIEYSEDVLFERSFEQQNCEMGYEFQVLFDE